MDEILIFLARHMNFLWINKRFQIEGSIGGTGDAGIYLRSDTLRIFVVRDKGQLFLDMQPVAASRIGTEWYSVDLVYESISKRESRQTSLLDPEYAQYVEIHLDEIERRFSDECWSKERVRLRELAKKRSKRLFPGRPL